MTVVCMTVVIIIKGNDRYNERIIVITIYYLKDLFSFESVYDEMKMLKPIFLLSY
jgi:hypothetical protein